MNNMNGGNKSFKGNTQMLVTLAILIALNVVLSRFLSFNAWNLKIGFTFVSVFVAAYLYGPIGSVTVAVLGDVIGALLFPSGPFFPGFTFTALITGLIYGIALGKKQTLPRIGIAVLLNQGICSLLINTYWISMLYGASFKALIATRSIQCIVMFVVEIVVMYALSKAFDGANLKRIAAVR